MKEQETPEDNYEVNHNPERKLGIIAGGGELPQSAVRFLCRDDGMGAVHGSGWV